MATVPKATTRVSDTASAQASGTDTIALIVPCATSADAVPRLFGGASAAYAQHGYCAGVEYSAAHAVKTGKSFIIVGIPIATPGVVGRIDQTGNTGTSTCTPTAGGSGVLGPPHDGVVQVTKGGVVGTDQIQLALSLDAGRNFKAVRLGSGTSYAIPLVGVTLTFVSGGTLVAGDTVVTWHGTEARGDATGWQSAFDALGRGQRFFRTAMLMGALQSSSEASAFLGSVNGYETTYERFIRARASLPKRLPLAAMSKVRARMTGAPALTFSSVAHTITRSVGSWITDGFVTGDMVTVAGSTLNNGSSVYTVTSATVLTAASGVVAEGPVSGCTVSASPLITFAEVGVTGDTITRSRGSWLDDGVKVGDVLVIAGTASNNGTTDAISAVTATVITLNTFDLTPETIGAASCSISASITKAAHIAATDSKFETVNGYRLDLGYDGDRESMPFAVWDFLIPASWVASLREYQHDLQIPTWRKQDGSTGGDLFDTNKVLVQYDDRTAVDGGAASAARFTSLRTWGNGPGGSFVSNSLTRGDDGSLLSQSHNVDVVNLACTIVQLNTELIIGRVVVLNSDGTITSADKKILEKQVNDELERALLTNTRGEGQRASSAVWTASSTDVLNIPNAVVTGVLSLNLLGTIHDVITTVRVQTGG